MITQGESLPNIRGFINVEGLTRDYPGTNVEQSGAFSFYSGQKSTPHLGPCDYMAATGIGFDAALYNSVYKDNTQVTPKNTSIKIWKRIA